MNNATLFFPDLMETLGWTLLNSLWQGLIVMLLVVIVLRFTPSRLSTLRYGIACASLGILVLLSIATFLFLMRPSQSLSFLPAVSAGQSMQNDPLTFDQWTVLENFLPSVISKITDRMPLLIFSWAIGSILFMMRIVSGWFYLNLLKTEGTKVENWAGRLQEMSRQLNIQRIVQLVESSKIQTPMVIGYFKPIILIPAGMIAGLSTEQLETIFIHELAHIRRHDYLVNLLQSLIESLLFFNPFVWMLSAIIRREREYCCDDTVIATRGSSLAYAKALTHLEEIRLSSPLLAVSLAENKNQLLSRIKRIMEKSAKKYSNLDKLLPAVLLVLGLTCASWLTINSEKYHSQNEAKNLALQDTARKKSDKSTSYSKTTIITFDEKGEPHEETFEEFSGDDEFAPMIPTIDMIPMIDVAPVVPDVPGVPMPLIDLSGMVPPAIPDFPADMLSFPTDTFPPPGMRFRSNEDWEKFGKVFQEKFRQQFGEFYKSNEKEFEKMMEELQNTFKEKFDEDELFTLNQKVWSQADEEKMRAKMEKLRDQVSDDVRERMMESDIQAQKFLERARVLQQENLRKMEGDMREQGEQLKKIEREMKVMEERMQAFEKELKEELIKDGYIKKGEKIDDIRIDDDGAIEVNGKPIKSSDQKKYKDLHEKYFNKRGSYRYTE